MSIPLPPLDPALSAAALAELAPRLLKRAEKLAADSDTWEVHADSTAVRITIGQSTVTLTDALTCDCLLSPRCAHIGAVCVAAPVGEATVAAEPTASPPEAPAEDPKSNSNSEGAAWAKELPAPAVIAEIVASVNGILAGILGYGLGQLSIQQHTELLACVQRARVCGLPRLERALTAVATCSQHMRMGRPIGRLDATIAIVRLAYLCHCLERDPADREAIGQARRAYATLDAQSGVGAGMFTPIYAEPIVTASGFAGVSVVLMTSQGGFYSVTKTPPGDADDIAAVWHGPIRLGDLHCSHAQLAQRVLMVTGGKASSDGRIGSGKGVRAALGKPVTLDMVKALPLGDGLLILEGTMTAITFKGMTLQSAEDIPPSTLGFTAASRKAELASFVEACQRYLSNEVPIPCACLVRDGTVLCFWPLDTSFELPAEFGGRVFPGLGRVPVPAFANAYANTVGAAEGDDAAHRSVSDVVNPWLARAALGGYQMVLRRHQELHRDAEHLESLAAPFAATLLRNLLDQQTPQACLALALYANKL